MNTKLQSFIDVFRDGVSLNGQQTCVKEIVIPKIQRDYAQGRKDSEATRVRSRFLSALYEAITNNETLTLDFAYGSIKNGKLLPLDGQQRLTTLYLLHYYVAKKEKISDDKYAFLKGFRYETRYAAREFCEKLISFTPSFEEKISTEIENQTWFPLDWKNDATVGAMLVMLDDINEKFKHVENMWEKLENGAISFYFLALEDMGITDELYIKMNSRGKPLTPFEHFKAEFERQIRSVSAEKSREIMRKIDGKWEKLLWKYRGEDNVIDDEFLRYLRYVCDIICYKNGGTPSGKDFDEFDLINEYFAQGEKLTAEEVFNNLNTLENFFDCWYDSMPVCDLFNKYISCVHEKGKIKLDENKLMPEDLRANLDLFEECLKLHGSSVNKKRKFPLNRMALLYAFILYLQNRETITEDAFSCRLRSVDNMLQNSGDEVRDHESGSGGNRMPAILKQIEGVILYGKIESEIYINGEKKPSLNVYQTREEIEKQTWLASNLQHMEALFELEDHELLEGQISIVGLQDTKRFERFKELFNCDRDLVNCALMAKGNYAQKESWTAHHCRFQLGTSADNPVPWRNLFHQSQRSTGFENTKQILFEILDLEEISNESLKKVIDDFVAECEEKSYYDFRYYFIKYDIFRPKSRYGKYAWETENINDNQYGVLAMWTETKLSESSYQPFLKEVYDVSPDTYGNKIIIGDKEISCEKTAYVERLVENGEETARLEIEQVDGIDCENRIEKFRTWFATRT